MRFREYAIPWLAWFGLSAGISGGLTIYVVSHWSVTTSPAKAGSR